MWFACSNVLEWSISITACVLALVTALQLARWLAARLSGLIHLPRANTWLRFGWLFGMVYLGLLLGFNGRYRDLPMGLFALPCVGYALVALLSEHYEARLPMVEERFLAACLPVLGATVVVQNLGLSPGSWLWLAWNLALAAPVLSSWYRARQNLRLNPQQA